MLVTSSLHLCEMMRYPHIPVKVKLLFKELFLIFANFSRHVLCVGWGYPVQKLKQLEMGNAGSEMKRESNLGTGKWSGTQ